jgi:hypothetical protein
MFVVGGLTMIAFFTWEWRYARFPLMPKRVMNRTMVRVNPYAIPTMNRISYHLIFAA